MNLPSLRPWAWRGLWAASMMAAAIAAGCGGGVGTGGTGSFASGPITGFGSVIVNDVRFEDAAARVEDADGSRRTRDDLRLGMTVEIDSSPITTTATGATASASRIRFESELLGPLASVDGAGGSLTMLGQRVVVDASTVFDESLTGGLRGLAAGRMVEVYAVFDPAGARYRATRVAPAAGAALFRLRAPLGDVDAAAQTLRIGTTSYRYAGATGVPPGLAAGQFVRLRLVAAVSPAVGWVVQAFGAALAPLPDADGAKLKGLISAYTSAASFSVNGRPVDASGAGFPDGSAGLALGVRVEVEGTLRAGTLRASKVSIESDDEEHARGFELSGAITSVNAAQRTLVLRGQTVSTARGDLRYEGGTVADLVAGRRVEVRGMLSADGQRIEATRIKFE